jgi:hypothetical protein
MVRFGSRFSLKTLLVLTAFVAAGCYWWIARPTMVAKRFVAAINRDDRAAARAMVARTESKASIWPRANRLPPVFEARLEALTWQDLWRGERRIEFKISPHPAEQELGFFPESTDRGAPIRSTLTASMIASRRAIVTTPPYLMLDEAIGR